MFSQVTNVCISSPGPAKYILSLSGISKSGCWDVTYTSRRVCALVGSTVDISCTYSHPSGSTVYNTFWHYVQPGGFKDLREDQDFAGRVEYVGNKLRVKELKIKLTISDVRERDSGEYLLMFIMEDGVKHLSSAAVSLTVTGETELRFWSLQLFSFDM
uniref:Immunoglobulin domain-containing protein n=1 Tax=Sinocyclocheilus anshuiensis TaxID=1608454 RepID=A0A671N1N6_9TELE